MLHYNLVPEAAIFDEANLVTQARHGNTGAFGELTERYQRNIFRLAQNITQNREDAEDVLQETFLKAYEHLPEFHGDSKFYTWIVRIAVSPWGQVEIDGKAAGTAPPLTELTLSEGRHQITIRNEDFPPYSASVSIAPGQPVTLKHKFGS